MRFRLVTSLVVFLAAAGPAAAAGPPAFRGVDPHAAHWQLVLTNDDAHFPAIAQRADRRVARRPLYFQVAFVAGAIGGHRDHRVCPLVLRRPHDFARAAQRQIFQGPADYAYIRARGWTVGSVVATYRDGVLFGCRH